ncbi:MAG: hypothetical protein IE919_19180 [Thioclava sp.]|nr:hypothetical protein [Thioclava sp.]MBD3805336.1 hypothetical protein [Thioclava sp.]
MSPHVLQIGDHLIDLLNPDPAKIDPVAVIRRLSTIRRFGGEPFALTVLEHMELTGLVAEILAPTPALAPRCRAWGRRHDLHEGLIGDVILPVSRLVDRGGQYGLEALKARLDTALAGHFNTPGLGSRVRAAVARADAVSASIEWLHVMDRPPVSWLVDIPPRIPFSTLTEARMRASLISSAASVGRLIGYGAAE